MNHLLTLAGAVTTPATPMVVPSAATVPEAYRHHGHHSPHHHHTTLHHHQTGSTSPYMSNLFAAAAAHHHPYHHHHHHQLGHTAPSNPQVGHAHTHHVPVEAMSPSLSTATPPTFPLVPRVPAALATPSNHHPIRTGLSVTSALTLSTSSSASSSPAVSIPTAAALPLSLPPPPPPPPAASQPMNPHLGTMYATKRRRRNSKNIRLKDANGSHHHHHHHHHHSVNPSIAGPLSHHAHLLNAHNGSGNSTSTTVSSAYNNTNSSNGGSNGGQESSGQSPINGGHGHHHHHGHHPAHNQTSSNSNSPPVKTNPSKRHRERLNSELDMLASLLPFEPSVLSKLDKLSILRLSVSYLRTKSYFQAALRKDREALKSSSQTGNSDSTKVNGYPSDSSTSNSSSSANSTKFYESMSSFHAQHHHHQQQQQQAQQSHHQSTHAHYHTAAFTEAVEMLLESDLILQALNGFLLILTCDGEVFYTSHTVETYLGFHQSDICHQSVYELVHSEDREELQRHLMWNANLPPERAALKLSDVLLLENCYLLERNFTVRFRCLLDNTSGFLRLDVRGRIKILHGQNHKSEEPPMALFAVCTPFGPPSLLEMPVNEKALFKSKHKLDFALVSMEPRGRALLGYTENELTNRGGYDLIHHDDLLYVASAHQELLKTGASGLIAYRLVSKDCVKWQWLQTSARLVYKNSKPDFILCTHRPLMEEEGRDLLSKRTMDFKVTYLDGGLGAITVNRTTNGILQTACGFTESSSKSTTAGDSSSKSTRKLERSSSRSSAKSGSGVGGGGGGNECSSATGGKCERRETRSSYESDSGTQRSRKSSGGHGTKNKSPSSPAKKLKSGSYESTDSGTAFGTSGPSPSHRSTPSSSSIVSHTSPVAISAASATVSSVPVATNFQASWPTAAATYMAPLVDDHVHHAHLAENMFGHHHAAHHAHQSYGLAAAAAAAYYHHQNYQSYQTSASYTPPEEVENSATGTAIANSSSTVSSSTPSSSSSSCNFATPTTPTTTSRATFFSAENLLAQHSSSSSNHHSNNKSTSGSGGDLYAAMIPQPRSTPYGSNHPVAYSAYHQHTSTHLHNQAYAEQLGAEETFLTRTNPPPTASSLVPSDFSGFHHAHHPGASFAPTYHHAHHAHQDPYQAHHHHHQLKAQESQWASPLAAHHHHPFATTPLATNAEPAFFPNHHHSTAGNSGLSRAAQGDLTAFPAQFHPLWNGFGMLNRASHLGASVAHFKETELELSEFCNGVKETDGKIRKRNKQGQCNKSSTAAELSSLVQPSSTTTSGGGGGLISDTPPASSSSAGSASMVEKRDSPDSTMVWSSGSDGLAHRVLSLAADSSTGPKISSSSSQSHSTGHGYSLHQRGSECFLSPSSTTSSSSSSLVVSGAKVESIDCTGAATTTTSLGTPSTDATSANLDIEAN